MLVVYCGVVIFITKPESFAFSGILGDYNTITGTNKAQLMEEVSSLIDEKVDAAINDKVSSYVDSKINSAINSAIDSAINGSIASYVDSKIDNALGSAINESIASYVDSKIASALEDKATSSYVDSKVSSLSSSLEDVVDAKVNEALQALEAKILQEKDTLVSSFESQISTSSNVDETAIIDYVNSASYIDSLTSQLVEAVIAELEKNLDTYAPEVASAVLPELEKDLEQYLPYIVDAVLKSLPQSSSTAEVSSPSVDTISDVSSSMSESEYDAIREEMRNNEISSILSQLN